MSRVKRGTMHVKRRRNLRAAAKGYRWGRKKLQKLAKVAVTKAGVYAHRDRRNKKRAFRRLWQVRLNAAMRMRGTNYSTFINRLKKAGIALDRKSLSNLAVKYPAVFDKIVEKTR